MVFVPASHQFNFARENICLNVTVHIHPEPHRCKVRASKHWNHSHQWRTDGENNKDSVPMLMLSVSTNKETLQIKTCSSRIDQNYNNQGDLKESEIKKKKKASKESPQGKRC